ncbi:hypothetical protein N7G274_001262 [Stereocaulon virgatum]|uniref:Major facilitator superfamily (MFS) profile domain-containing protein n=1 Tax=Stereocaulon virgatum TaxID=373712 RepID=A0ABR4AUU5_9LECA
MNQDMDRNSSKSIKSGHLRPNNKAENATSFDVTVAGAMNERKLLRKIDLRVLPTITVIYVLAFLDRVNIGNALLYGLPKDLHLQGTQLNIALSVFFVTYCIFEIPANVLMKKLSPQTFLSASVFLCGLLAISQGFVNDFRGLVTVRVLLGIAEAGIFPGCFYLIGMWYKPSEAQRRFSLFFNAGSFAGAFGGLLASAIGKMEGVRGYHAWRWVFMLEGLLSCILSIAAFFLIANFPEHANWLSEDERAFVVARLAADEGSSGVDERISWQGILETFKDWKMIPGALMYFGPTVSTYGLAYFIPSIVATYGHKPIEAQLYSVIPWAAAMVFGMSMAFASDGFQNRSAFIVFGLCIAISGNLTLSKVHKNRKAEFAGLILYTMGVIGILPILLCWFSMNLKSHRRRLVGTAWQLGFGNIAGIVAPFAFQSKDAPRYHLGYSLGLGCLCLAGAASLTYFMGCFAQNKQRTHGHKLIL